ncbi:hypothetical protein M405DRAFT_426450 [Rhizopogon salebrosus TDB-379]|nr:hypothetical protein M405DRAFT_426450 [Rhizopogon salebrosus TDB-379]
MSQGILIHRREASKSDTRHLDNVVVARPAPHARKLMPPLPTHFDCKGQGGPVNADLTSIPHSNGHNNDVELDIRVHVERSVVVNYMNDPAHSSPWG